MYLITGENVLGENVLTRTYYTFMHQVAHTFIIIHTYYTGPPISSYHNNWIINLSK